MIHFCIVTGTGTCLQWAGKNNLPASTLCVNEQDCYGYPSFVISCFAMVANATEIARRNECYADRFVVYILRLAGVLSQFGVAFATSEYTCSIRYFIVFHLIPANAILKI